MSSDLHDLVASIVARYRSEPDALRIDSARLPDRDAIVDVIAWTRQILFPGYFGRKGLSSDTAAYYVGDLLIKVEDRLLEQVTKAMLHCPERGGERNDHADEAARRVVNGFLRSLPNLFSILASDVRAAFDGDPAAVDSDEVISSYPGLFAISVYRIAHELYVRDVPLIPRIMTEYAHGVTGIDIHAGASIGRFFFIDHGTGVVIGETTVIGERVKMYQGVTLGAMSTRGGQKLRGVKRHPTLEDDVTVYSGASILGGDTVIGEGVTISSNAFVTTSVPARTRVTVKNPELLFKGQKPVELKQDMASDWVI